jgi:squalene monooxygenase
MLLEVVIDTLFFCLRSPFVGLSVAFTIIFTTSLLFSFTNKKKVDQNLLPNSRSEFAETVLVVGGGVAGCTVALALASRGFKVVLVERDMSEQDRIVGELLQPGGIRALERLGLSDCAVDGIDSVDVQGYVILNPDSKTCASGSSQQTVLKYPTRDPNGWLEQFGTINSDSFPGSILKEPRGRSFHHGRFVQNLRGKVLAHPLIEVIEGTVTKLLEEDGRIVGVEYRKREEATQKINPDEPTISDKVDQRKLFVRRSSITLIADGIWSNFRKTLSSAQITNVGSFVGLVVDHPPMQSPVPFPLHGHVILADPTPCLIYQISSTETRILVDVQGKMPSISGGEMKRYMVEKICPQLPACFRAPFLAALESKELKSMPCKFFPAKPSLKVGALLIGDALNMRNPLTGCAVFYENYLF